MEESEENKLLKQIETLKASSQMQEAFRCIEKDSEYTLKQQLELVKIPAFSNNEKERAIYFQKLMEEEGYPAHMDSVCNVYTTIRGTGNGPAVMMTAHLDTVFPMDTPLKIKKEGARISVPGIGDDTRGCAEILALLRVMRMCALKPVGDIIIGCNVGEEGNGNLRGMRQFFKDHPDKIDVFFSIDSAGPGICFGGTGSHRYRVTFRGPGGHSMGAFGLVNPIHAMGRAISLISDMRTPAHPKTTFCVGVVAGGTSVNAIASECSMMVDLRSNGQTELKALDEQFRSCTEKAVQAENDRWEEERGRDFEGVDYFDKTARIRAEFEQIGDRPTGSQPEGSRLVEILSAVFKASGTEPEMLEFGSTDSNIPLSLGIPAVTVSGGGTTGDAHSLSEWYDPTDAFKGVQKNLLMLFSVAGLDGVSEPIPVCLPEKFL